MMPKDTCTNAGPEVCSVGIQCSHPTEPGIQQIPMPVEMDTDNVSTETPHIPELGFPAIISQDEDGLSEETNVDGGTSLRVPHPEGDTITEQVTDSEEALLDDTPHQQNTQSPTLPRIGDDARSLRVSNAETGQQNNQVPECHVKFASEGNIQAYNPAKPIKSGFLGDPMRFTVKDMSESTTPKKGPRRTKKHKGQKGGTKKSRLRMEMNQTPSSGKTPYLRRSKRIANKKKAHALRAQALHGHAINPDTGAIAEYKELAASSEGHFWQASNAMEIGRLAQGYKDQKGTNTLFFIHKHEIPRGKKATYLRVVSAYRPEKEVPHRVRWTVGGNRIEYNGAVTTETADMTLVKLLLNSVVSTPNAKFMTMDLKDFYLGTLMKGPEFMRVPVHMIPEEIMKLYNLYDKVVDGYVYVKICKGMYGLPQAGRIANEQLKDKLAPFGFHPCDTTPGLWKHESRPITFCLVVDDFGVKYTNKEDVEYLIECLSTHYKISIDWEGQRYVGLHMDWDYTNRTCTLSMPGYIERALQRFKHTAPKKKELSPHEWNQPVYGRKQQYEPEDHSPALDAKDSKRVQEIVGTLLYYARAVDSTMLPSLNTIAATQSKSTMNTLKAVTKLLNYCASNPEASVQYKASEMILWADSDASYLSAPKARSRAGGYFFLSNKPNAATTGSGKTLIQNNGPVHVLCLTMREIVSSAAEAELGALFYNGKEVAHMREALQNMGHPQPPTPIQTDNTTAIGISTDSVKQKRSKAMDMRFYWTRDRVRQGQFHIYWKPGKYNKADYFTKHHPAKHHQAIRSTYLFQPGSKNYFECLADDDNEETSHDKIPNGNGEGVLIDESRATNDTGLSHSHSDQP